MADERSDKPGRKNGRSNNGSGGLRFGRGVFGWLLFIGLVVMLVALVNRGSGGAKPIDMSVFWTELNNGNIKEMTIDGDDIYGVFITKKAIPTGGEIEKFRATFPIGNTSQWSMIKEILEINRAKGGGMTITALNNSNIVIQILGPLIPWLLIFAFVWFFIFRQLRNSAGAGGMLGNFGRSRHKITSKEHTNVTFDDVAGVEEAKEEVMEIVEFLKNPKKFQRLGGRIPRGVLLVGEPGTGKTLLAKAIAGEADVPFFSISGSDFVEMFVGVGASRVRDLFKQAKDNSPCIIFLDEIDAVGRRRGSGFSSGGHDEREQTLNAILVEMDGFDTNDQVIVIAATNRVDVLDPALTRPGRFDRQIAVPLPDVKGRLEILKVHSRKVKLGPNVDLARLAKATSGFSGADLAATINESALGATLANKEFIEQDDLEEARDKVRWGRARKSAVIDEKDKAATAYHEAGHAVVQFLEKDADPIHKVTIIPRGQALGSTMTLPERDHHNHSRRWCLAFIRMGLAGRIAEEMFTGDINTGAYGDIRQVTGLARKMIRDWGMNDKIGFVFYGEDNNRPGFEFGAGREYSDDTARAIDEEVKKLIDGLQEETKSILAANRERVEAVAKALLKYETLDTGDIDRIMRGDTLTKPTVGDLLEKERGRRAMPPTKPESDIQPGLGGGPLPRLVKSTIVCVHKDDRIQQRAAEPFACRTLLHCVSSISMRRVATAAWFIPSVAVILSAFVPLVIDFRIQDADWLHAISAIHGRGLVYGRDILFTYGPWGFLWGNFYPTTSSYIWVAWTVIAMAVWWALLQLVRSRFAGPAALQGLLLLIMVLPLGGDNPVSPDARLLSLAPLLLILHFFVRSRTIDPAKLLLTAVNAWAGTIKLTYLITGLVAVAIITIDELAARREPRRWRRLLTGATYVLTLCMAWILSGQRLFDLPRYLASSLEIATAYPEAMVLWRPQELSQVLICLLPAALLLTLVLLVAAKVHRWRSALLLIGLIALFHIAFRAGFVRNDYHAMMVGIHYFAIAVICCIATWPAMRSYKLKIAWGICLLAAGFSASRSLGEWRAYSLRIQLSETFSNTADESRELVRILTGRRGATATAWHEHVTSPEISLKPVNPPGRIDAFSMGMATLLANGINYHPRPTLTAYAAYTPELTHANARMLAGSDAPDHMLFCIYSVSGHLPTIEDSASWLEMLRSYRVEEVLPPYLILAKRAKPRVVELKPIGEFALPLGQQLELPPDRFPSDPRMIWAKVRLARNPIGQLAGQIYKPPQLILGIRTRGRSNMVFSLIPSLAADGFLLGPVVTDTAFFGKMLDDGPDAPNDWNGLMPAAISLREVFGFESNWYFNSPAHVELFSLTLTEPP